MASFGSKKPGSGKKLVIKGFKTAAKIPDDFENKTWETLRAAVAAIHKKQATSTSFEELYTAVQDLCLHNFAQNTYNRLHGLCDTHTHDSIAQLVTGRTKTVSSGCDTVEFLQLVAHTWDFHCDQIITLKQIFGYLDRTYVINSNSLRTIWDMGLDLFRKHLSTANGVLPHLVSGIMEQITRERNGDTIDRSLLQKLIRMFLSLQIYTPNIQTPFLEMSQDHYAAEGRELLHRLTVANYLEHIERRLSEEKDRILHYMDETTRRPIILVVEEHLIKIHVSSILEKGFTSLMEGNQLRDLGRLYHLLGCVSAHQQLRECFKSYIQTTGLLIVMDEEKDPQMVQELLAFKRKLNEVWKMAFHKQERFGHTLKDSFELFVNKRHNKPAELIAKFIDGKLRPGNKSETEDELEVLMDEVMMIFRFVNSKDVFEAFYKKDAAKRLLLNKSASLDQEKNIIAKLKAECGTQLSGKLEGMFKDVDVSKEIMNSFKQSKEARDPRMGDVDLNVYVLTTGYWPAYPPLAVKLPNDLSQHQELFKEYYLGRYQGRKLQWLPNLAHCVVKANYPKGKKELQLSLLQTLILLLYNDVDELQALEIQKHTGIEDVPELCRTLQSLALGNARVLRKRPKGKDILKTDYFAYDADFSHKLYRLKVNQIQMKETPEEAKQTHGKVLQDRSFQIDAAIVRIMKARQSLPHNDLIKELFTILRFPVTALDLKKRIESLIERDYLSRDETNTSQYHYVA